jgi:hypothetical protein
LRAQLKNGAATRETATGIPARAGDAVKIAGRVPKQATACVLAIGGAGEAVQNHRGLGLSACCEAEGDGCCREERMEISYAFHVFDKTLLVTRCYVTIPPAARN